MKCPKVMNLITKPASQAIPEGWNSISKTYPRWNGLRLGRWREDKKLSNL